MGSIQDNAKINIQTEQRKIQFCPYCGAKLNEGSHFCSNCGAPISVTTNTTEGVKPVEKDTQKEVSSKDVDKDKTTQKTERKIVYEGDLHKCPNCGEILDAFVTRCPSCGYELRGAKSSSTVQALSNKLEEISSRKMPEPSGKKSGKIIVTAKAAQKRQEAAEQARNDFEKQKDNEKASLISNFAVPNTKEDILEFTIMAAANIDTKSSKLDTVSNAWASKLEQAYHKAEITLAGQPELTQIEQIYERKMRDVRVAKLKVPLLIVILAGAWFVLLSVIGIGDAEYSLAIPCLVIGILLLIAAAVIFYIVFIAKNKEE